MKTIGKAIEFFLKSIMNIAGLVFGLLIVVFAGMKGTPPWSWIGVISGMIFALGAGRELKRDYDKFCLERDRP